MTGNLDGTMGLWEVETGRRVRNFEGHTGYVRSLAFSRDGKRLTTSGFDGTARLWEVETGKEQRRFEGFEGLSTRPTIVALSSDDKFLAMGGRDNVVRMLEVETGRELRRFTVDSSRSVYISSVVSSPDGKYIVTTATDGTARLWEVETGREVRRLQKHIGGITSSAFTGDGAQLVTGGMDKTARLWEVETGREVRRFHGHHDSVISLALSSDGRHLVTSSSDSTTRIWDITSGRELCSLISFVDGSWAVTDQEGRYDSSNAGNVEGLHWVVGNETISLEQLKERYYEPGLLTKVINRQPLRQVTRFSDVKLFPAVNYEAPSIGSTNLAIKLTNRGGGIGRVRVLLNGKEITADARGPMPDPQSATSQLSVDLSSASLDPGGNNTIEVLAWNAEGYLRSRGTKVIWSPKSAYVARAPQLYAIVAGVSTYSTGAITLRYAAKDAEDMAKALQLGARRLFGADKVHLRVLSTSGRPGTVQPTKENLRRAFEEARKARPEDVLVVYLAGHGIALRLTSDVDLYCFLTQEARTTDLTDPEVRRASSVSSEDMVDWIKQIPALKQVMILDTCAAGAALTKLTESRNPSGEQIRAIERLKDRTGFHVLMGSAADKVSYEASQYSQGLLTYALLEGMKGAALQREEFVDVSRLFQYAADRVPQLARSIGLGSLQRPVPAVPRGGASFDVGQLKREDKEAIPLARPLPLVLRPRLLNPDEGFDNLELEPAVRRRLDERSWAASRATAGPPEIVYVDADELPAALRPSGTYRVDGQRVKVVISLIRDRQRVASFELEGRKNELSGLSTSIVERIVIEVGKIAQ